MATLRRRSDTPRALRLAYLFVDGAVWLGSAAVLFAVFAFSLGGDGPVGNPVGVTQESVVVEAEKNIMGLGEQTPYERSRIAELYGPETRVLGSNRVKIRVTEPTPALWVSAAAAALLYAAALIHGLVLVRRMLRRALEGAPFDVRNANDLRRLGILVAGGAFVVPLTQHLIAEWAVRQAGGEGDVMWSFGFVVPMLVGVLLLALAEAWRYGVTLQREPEATV